MSNFIPLLDLPSKGKIMNLYVNPTLTSRDGTETTIQEASKQCEDTVLEASDNKNEQVI